MNCQDANTGIKIQVSSKAANIAFGIAVSGTGDTRTITISTNTAGTYLFRVWLIDDSTDPNQLTPTVPSGDSTVEWFRTTNSSGVLTLNVTHDGTHNWYPAATLLGPVGVGDVLQYT